MNIYGGKSNESLHSKELLQCCFFLGSKQGKGRKHCMEEKTLVTIFILKGCSYSAETQSKNSTEVTLQNAGTSSM